MDNKYNYDATTEEAMERDLRALADAVQPSSERELVAIREEASAIPSQWAGLLPPHIERAPKPRRSSFVGGFIAGIAVLSLSLAAYAAHRSFQSSVRAEPAAIAVPATADPAREAPIAIVTPEPIVTPPQASPAPTTQLETHAPVARTTTRARARVVPDVTHHVAAPTPVVTAPTSSAQTDLDRSLAQLLDGALGEHTAAQTAPALPLVPTQASVRTTLRALERRVDACQEGSAGIAVARLAIDGATGRVRQVSVTGVDAAEAACIQSVVSSARFEPFAQSDLSVSFPYRVR